jgi:hypothetical protein
MHQYDMDPWTWGSIHPILFCCLFCKDMGCRSNLQVPVL